jgi:heptosyltransferase I
MFEQSPPESICVIRLSAIGDTCHALAVVRAIQDTWPETRITWIIGKTEASLLADIPDIEFIIFDKSKGRDAYADVRNQLAGRKFSVALCMHASLRANLLCRLISTPNRLGFDYQRARDFQWLFTNQRIEATPHEHFRNWSAENYAAAANHARNKFDCLVILTGGKSELELEYGRTISKLCDSSLVNLIGKTSLKELFALISISRALICPDSGPAHMATAAGTPVIGLYATSNPDRTGPYLSRDLSVNRYPEAVGRFLGKTVEDLRWGQRVRDPGAMGLIRLASVNRRIDQVFSPSS